MHHHVLRAIFVLLCAQGIAFAAALAQPAQAQQTPRTGQDGTGLAQIEQVLQQRRNCMRGCHPCWYKYFPGVVNYCLGMHDWKEGSYRGGLQFLKLAAGWGNKNAQYTLGLIYFNGHHVAPDRARGIAWLMLANQRHNDAQTERVTRSAMHVSTAEQRKQAQRLFQEMRKKYGDKVAGVRAWRHLRNRLKFNSLFSPRPWCIQEGGGVVPWSSGFSANPHMLCMVSGDFSKTVAKIASKYFDGLRATVHVGPLRQVPAPASSSTP